MGNELRKVAEKLLMSFSVASQMVFDYGADLDSQIIFMNIEFNRFEDGDDEEEEEEEEDEEEEDLEADPKKFTYDNLRVTRGEINRIIEASLLEPLKTELAKQGGDFNYKEVMLVGGGSRYPLIKDRLQELLKAPKITVEPDS